MKIDNAPIRRPQRRLLEISVLQEVLRAGRNGEEKRKTEQRRLGCKLATNWQETFFHSHNLFLSLAELNRLP